MINFSKIITFAIPEVKCCALLLNQKEKRAIALEKEVNLWIWFWFYNLSLEKIQRICSCPILIFPRKIYTKYKQMIKQVNFNPLKMQKAKHQTFFITQFNTTTHIKPMLFVFAMCIIHILNMYLTSLFQGKTKKPTLTLVL